MWNSIQNGLYVRPMIPDPDGSVNINGTMKQILEPLFKMTEGNKKQYIADVKVMSYLLQAIPNDIYNSVDALQLEPHVLASKAKKAAKNYDPLALIAHSNASSSQSHVNSSYSPQPYYVTHPSSVVDYENEYQGELQGDSQEDKLTTAMMLLAQVITQKFSTPTNNCIRTSSNTKNQVVIHDGRVDIQTKNAGYGGNEQENRYLEDIVDLEEKPSSHDRIVYKMGQSLQTIHMLRKTANKVYDPFIKVGLGYKNPDHLKKAIAAQPKMYDGEKLHSVNLKTDSPDSEETLEDAEESRLKIRNKMVQINYGKLNALYETFVPQQDFSMEQTYFLIPSTSTNGS
nr:hypothetical protein [Tanacetum cinerariifolium]